MGSRKRKLTPAERAGKKARRKEFMTIFVGGRQKRVRRPPAIGGLDADEFIRRNADPVWLHQNEMWEYIPDEPEPETGGLPAGSCRRRKRRMSGGRL